MCTEKRIVTRLAFWRQFSEKKLSRSVEYPAYLNGLACRTAAYEQQLFLSDYSNRVVRSFDVHFGGLAATEVHTGEPNEIIHDVAYSAETDTLFVGSTFRRPDNQFIQAVSSFSRPNVNSSD